MNFSKISILSYYNVQELQNIFVNFFVIFHVKYLNKAEVLHNIFLWIFQERSIVTAVWKASTAIVTTANANTATDQRATESVTRGRCSINVINHLSPKGLVLSLWQGRCINSMLHYKKEPELLYIILCFYCSLNRVLQIHFRPNFCYYCHIF